jgi:hypothetical protein
LDNSELRVLAENTVPNLPEIPKGIKMAMSNDLLFVAALGYKQIEVLDLKTLKVLKTLQSDVEINEFKLLVKS